MENKILIKYKDKSIAIIDTNTPDLNDLKKFVINQINDGIDCNLIKCECDNVEFDTNFLTTAIVSAIKDEIELLKIDKKEFETAMEQIEKPQN